MQTFEIRAATSTDLSAVQGIFASAFVDDPVWTAIVPRARQRARMIAEEVRWSSEISSGKVMDVAVEAGGRVLGAVVAEPPHIQPHDSLLTRLFGALTMIGRRARRHERAIGDLRASTPHWYIHDVAVAPGAQNRGVGGALLRRRLTIADRDRLPTVLEATTEASSRLYRRHGFVTLGVVDVLPATSSQIMRRDLRR